LRKAAKAAGVKLNTSTPLVPAPTPAIEPGPASEKKSGFMAGGWSTFASSSSGANFKKSGWGAVSGPQKPPSPPLPLLPLERSHVAPNPSLPTTSASGFRSGGWTTLEGLPSTSTPNRPLTPNAYHPPPPPPEQTLIPDPPEPSASGSKPIPVAQKPGRAESKPVSRPVKNPSAIGRAESSRSGWRDFSRGGSRR